MLSHAIYVCGADQLDSFTSATHIIRIVNPTVGDLRPAWFNGDYLQLNFGDVISKADARAYNTRPARTKDILLSLDFSRRAWMANNATVLVSCDYGASRSPALAYVLWADKLGLGRELEAFTHILNIRAEAVPNNLVVSLGDFVLNRNKSLIEPLNEFNQSIMASLGLL